MCHIFVETKWRQEHQQGGQGEGGDGEEDVAVGKIEADGSENGGQEPVLEDGIMDTDDEVTTKDVRSKL